VPGYGIYKGAGPANVWKIQRNPCRQICFLRQKIETRMHGRENNHRRRRAESSRDEQIRQHGQNVNSKTCMTVRADMQRRKKRGAKESRSQRSLVQSGEDIVIFGAGHIASYPSHEAKQREARARRSTPRRKKSHFTYNQERNLRTKTGTRV
jgi:hypothetical protein